MNSISNRSVVADLLTLHSGVESKFSDVAFTTKINPFIDFADFLLSSVKREISEKIQLENENSLVSEKDYQSKDKRDGSVSFDALINFLLQYYQPKLNQNTNYEIINHSFNSDLAKRAYNDKILISQNNDFENEKNYDILRFSLNKMDNSHETVNGKIRFPNLESEFESNMSNKDEVQLKSKHSFKQEISKQTNGLYLKESEAFKSTAELSNDAAFPVFEKQNDLNLVKTNNVKYVSDLGQFQEKADYQKNFAGKSNQKFFKSNDFTVESGLSKQDYLNLRLNPNNPGSNKGNVASFKLEGSDFNNVNGFESGSTVDKSKSEDDQKTSGLTEVINPPLRELKADSVAESTDSVSNLIQDWALKQTAAKVEVEVDVPRLSFTIKDLEGSVKAVIKGRLIDKRLYLQIDQRDEWAKWHVDLAGLAKNLMNQGIELVIQPKLPGNFGMGNPLAGQGGDQRFDDFKGFYGQNFADTQRDRKPVLPRAMYTSHLGRIINIVG